MRKGLKSTLLTVAVALLGFKAMAMAPVIGSIPDVVIGDAEAGTATNLFVFPNAFDSRTLVSDDTTSSGAIRWTFSTAAASKYLINGKPSTFGNVVDTVNPAPAFDLTAGADTGDTASTDSDTRTFTFRNIHYSPIGGPNTDPGHPGVTTDSQTLTLVASDSSTASLGKSFRAMILNDGRDKLSGNVGISVYSSDWTTGNTNNWTSWNFTSGGGTVGLANSAAGLCANASASGLNFAGWQSEPFSTGYSTVTYVDNAVYRLRTTVSTTATGGNTPLWFLFYQNSLDWYGGYFQFFDNGIAPTPGAETPSASGTTYEEWLNPPAQALAEFKNVLADPTLTQYKNFRIEVGVNDSGVAGNDTYGALTDSGTICWKSMQIDRFDATGAVVTSTPYNRVSDFTQPPAGTAGVADSNPKDVTASSSGTFNGSSTVTYSAPATGGTITIAPVNASSWQSNAEFFTVLPGDSKENAGINAGADVADNYPIPWTTGQLYRIQYTLQAPSALAQSNPPGYFYMGGYCATIEIISYCYTTNQLVKNSHPSGMPITASPSTYTAYFHGNTASFAGGPFKAFRPILFGGSIVGSFQNPVVSGGVTVIGNRVDLIHF